jgi:hypothetical protein
MITRRRTIEGIEWNQTDIGGLRFAVVNREGAFRVHELYIDLDIRNRPTVNVTAPTGLLDVPQPEVQWTPTINDGQTQTRYQVRMYTEAQYMAVGFNPDTTTPLQDSGQLSGTAAKWVPKAPLTGSEYYRAYVRVAKEFNDRDWWSDWSYAQFRINQAPAMAVQTYPVSSLAIDRSVTQRLEWLFQDADVPAGDFQTRYQIRYRPVGNPVWITLPAVVSGNTFNDMIGGTFEESLYEWEVMVWDKFGVPSLWSSPAIFTAIDPLDPVFVEPLDLELVAGSPFPVSWTFAGTQQAFQVRKLADDDGEPNPNVPYYNSGIIPSHDIRTIDVPFLVDARREHVQVRVKRLGGFSPWASVSIHTQFAAPPDALITSVAVSFDEAKITIICENQVDGAWAAWDPPAVANDLYRKINGQLDSEAIRIASDLPLNFTYEDFRVASYVNYTYQVRARTDENGYSSSPWSEAASIMLLYPGTAVYPANTQFPA